MNREQRQQRSIGTLRHYVPNVILLMLTVVVVLTPFELYLRYRHQAWPFELPTFNLAYLTSRDQNLRWRYPPANDRNSLGLRNREINHKPPGTYRILFLGDSLIWNGNTTAGLLYTEVIETALNQELGSGAEKIEVINAGVPGYTTYQELEFLKVYGLDMEPDLVILGFVFNDLFPKYLHRTSVGKRLAWDPSAYLHRFDTSTLLGRLFGRSHLAHRLVMGGEFLMRRIRSRPIFPFDRDLGLYLAWKPYSWHHTTELISEMQDLLRERHIPLMALVFPMVTQVDDAYRNLDLDYVLYPQKCASQMFFANHIPFLDLTPALHSGGGPILYRDVVHLKPVGNDLVASEVIRFLLDHLEYWWHRYNRNVL